VRRLRRPRRSQSSKLQAQTGQREDAVSTCRQHNACAGWNGQFPAKFGPEWALYRNQGNSRLLVIRVTVRAKPGR
jgi:hypothetical protein